MHRFDYHDINLIPKKCVVGSRSECDTSVTLGNYTFKMPVIPANMECVMNDELAIKLASAGYFYIHHRFNTNTLEFALKMKNLNLPISISIGVNEDAYNILKSLYDSNIKPDFITIDIAHGHSIKMQHIIEWIRHTYKDQPFIIAGNVCTPEAVIDLESWGADAIKVGIGPGSACTTYNATGFGSRNIQASVIKDCTNACIESVIIADGGIKDPCDIVKSIVLGAKMVMAGGMFSALIDSPGSVVRIDGQLYKEFWGSASAFQNDKKQHIEGIKKLLLQKQRTMLEEIAYLAECLKSAISYGGGNNLDSLKEVKYTHG